MFDWTPPREDTNMTDWILTTDQLPESGDKPFHCKPVIARVVGVGSNFEDVMDCWQAIRCSDHEGVVRWYGITNDGFCVHDSPKYEELIDESVLAWTPWPEFEMTTQERVLMANQRMAPARERQEHDC